MKWRKSISRRSISRSPETPRVWREMLENIQRNGEADAQHDLNTLAHFGEALKVSYADPEGHDKLYRFMESIQEFFDLSSQVELSF